MSNKPANTTLGTNSRHVRLTIDFIAAALTACWLFAWRAALNIPWGFTPDAAPGGMLNIGISFNPTDTWSYLSWVQQYSHGQSLAGLIYTTEPHAPLLWLFPLWVIGKIAACTGLSVIGIYNIAGVIGAMTAVVCFRRAAYALRLTNSACNWSTVAFVLGSGASWLWYLAYKLGWASHANGGDRIFLDLFPSTAFVTYAFHSLGLALLAGLWWSATEFENGLHARLLPWKWLGATAVLALLLGFSRPYEPVAFFGAWLLKTAWHGLKRNNEPITWYSSIVVAIVLAFSLFPGIGWTVWVSKQPVWSTFASESLALGLPRSAWLWTLSGWIVFIVLGISSACRSNSRLIALPLAASLLLGTVLLGLGGAHTKLTSGLLLGPILLAGWGAAQIVTTTSSWPGTLRIVFGTAVIGALLGIPSLLLNLTAIKLQGPTLVDAELISLARQLPIESGKPPPVVLTDVETGNILPGLVGARVWVGHWSLSPHFKSKTTQLEQAGLDPHKTSSGNPSATSLALTAVLADARFDYALLDRRCSSALTVLVTRGWLPLETTSRWSLLRAPSPSP